MTKADILTRTLTNKKKQLTNTTNEIVNKYSNTYHKTIGVKPAVVELVMRIEYSLEHNDQDPKFKDDNV